MASSVALASHASTSTFAPLLGVCLIACASGDVFVRTSAGGRGRFDETNDANGFGKNAVVLLPVLRAAAVDVSSDPLSCEGENGSGGDAMGDGEVWEEVRMTSNHMSRSYGTSTKKKSVR